MCAISPPNQKTLPTTLLPYFSHSLESQDDIGGSSPYSFATTGSWRNLARTDSGNGEKFIATPRRSLALRLATTRPSALARISPLRKVGSSSALIWASPAGSLPLQVQPATISLR